MKGEIFTGRERRIYREGKRGREKVGKLDKSRHIREKWGTKDSCSRKKGRNLGWEKVVGTRVIIGSLMQNGWWWGPLY